jgi:hypothetical protein
MPQNGWVDRGPTRQISVVLVMCFAAVGCHRSATKDEKQPVVVRVQYPPKEPVFVEGAVTELQLLTRDGSTKATKQARTTVPVLLGSVDPGRYTLRADVRPCDANCGNLDPSAFRCHGPVVVPEVGDARVIVTVRSTRCDVDQQFAID